MKWNNNFVCPRCVEVSFDCFHTLSINSHNCKTMCLIKKKTEKDNAICAIIVGLILTIIILIIISFRFSNYILPFSEAKVDANITSSFGSVVGAFLAPLWSGIAVWIYYLALAVQSKELKASQEAAFGQNLSFLISNSTNSLNNLHIKINKIMEYEGYDVITFLYICLKYCYKIQKEEKIVEIADWEKHKEEKMMLEQSEFCDEERMIEDYEWERLSTENPQLYRTLKKEESFNKHKEFFIYLLELTNDDIKDRNDDNRCINSSFLRIWSKYGHFIMPYFLNIENCIYYLSRQNIGSKQQYASWITSNMTQPVLALFYYYLYCQKETKRQLILHCEGLKFFESLDKERFLLSNTSLGKEVSR